MARHPLIGYLVWAVLFGALFAWEGLALARVTGVPTLSDVFRVIMRYPVGRWARCSRCGCGPAGTSSSAAGTSCCGPEAQNGLVSMGPLTALSASADRQALVPVAAGYLILMSALALCLRGLCRPGATRAGSGQAHGGAQPDRPQAGPPGSPQRTGWAALAWQVTGTVVGGYLLLMAVVFGYYFAVARVGPGFLESAVTGPNPQVGAIGTR